MLGPQLPEWAALVGGVRRWEPQELWQELPQELVQEQPHRLHRKEHQGLVQEMQELPQVLVEELPQRQGWLHRKEHRQLQQGQLHRQGLVQRQGIVFPPPRPPASSAGARPSPGW